MRALKVQLIAALTVLAMLLPSVLGARTHFFCRMMDRVVATCCCDSGDSARDEQRCTTVRADDCCEGLTVSARTVSLAGAGNEPSIPVAAAAFTIPASVYFVPPAPSFSTRVPQARGPPEFGPPRFIANCALLT